MNQGQGKYRMLKFSSLMSITALCLAVAACQPGESPVAKVAAPSKNAPLELVTKPSINPDLATGPLVLPVVNADNLSEAVRLAEQSYTATNYEQGSQKQPAALEWYLAILRFDANNAEAQKGLKNTLDALAKVVQEANRSGNLSEAARVLRLLQLSSYQQSGIASLKQELEQAKQAGLWQQKAVELEKKSLVLTPNKGKQSGNAVAAYRKALEAFPDYQPASHAINRLRSQREIAALSLTKQGKFEAALIALEQAALVDDKSPQYQSVSRHIHGRLNQNISEQTVLANLALDGLRIKVAQDYYLKAKRILPTHPDVIALAARLDDARHYARFHPQQYFTDAWAMSSPAPELVVIKYGQFEMGASPNVTTEISAERPRRGVIFKRGFAIARNETTVGQFRQFIESSGYVTRASSRGWSMVFDEKGGSMTKRDNIDWQHDHLGRLAKDELPVVHVNLEDATAYAKWLTEKTGVLYRLPSEAEFEYVLRAGEDTIYPWGNEAPKKVVANLAGAGDKSTQSRSWGNAIEGYRDFHWGAAPVRSFALESWGTFDMSGNVEEWVQDCWHDSYQRAPVDGSAWVNPGCKMGVTRGASWASSLEEARVSFRTATPMKTHNARIGFRVVREL
jgi:formylglycine-generating enzyme required for sulfatase activity